ncbi:phosphatidylinositol 4-kinase type 2, partial [Phenoliferia sp. Uapishka_3]
MGRSTGYAPLPRDAPTDPDEDVADDATPHIPSTSSQPQHRPSPTALHVDVLFQRWTKTIAERMRRKRKNKSTANLIPKAQVPVDIIASVFEHRDSPEGTWTSGQSLKGKEKEREKDVTRTLDHDEPMTRDLFDSLVARVQAAIDQGVHPRLNAKGSSGSYFARDPSGTTLGIFKPKDEEPYGRLNPKFTKWVHREFLSRVIPFGRACLIPQLSYLSEAAAALLDRRLDSNIVPRTEVVSLSSPAFFYDFIDRERAARASKGIWRGRSSQLPPKPGSFQVFLKGFQDASDFLRKYPYPGRPLAQTLDPSPRRRKRITLFSPFRCLCGRAEAEEEDDPDGDGWGWGGEDGGAVPRGVRREGGLPFKWTQEMMNSFREELEKLVILDYLIRNTDRGLDNFMIKACYCTDPSPTRASALSPTPMSEVTAPSPIPSPSTAPPPSSGPGHIHIAAIDNSLAFPHLHPLGWRTYTYGWLYLPISCIGQPFSQKTREHYLPLLSDPKWWATTTMELRELFRMDQDFSEEMFRRQLAVIKGQAFNIVASLRDEDEGPLELCRRPKKLVWDDAMVVADDDFTRSLVAAASAPAPTNAPPTPPRTPSPPASVASPTPSNKRPSSPPPTMPVPLKRVSSDHTSRKRPAGRADRHHSRSLSSGVPIQEYQSLTGIAMLEHLEKVEKAERSQHPEKGKGREYQVVHSDDEGSEEDNADDGETHHEWGVKSEGDVREVRDVEGSWQDRVRERWSADLERGIPKHGGKSGGEHGRNRSESLGTMGRGGGSKWKGKRREASASFASESEAQAPPLDEGEEEESDGVKGARTKVVIVEVSLHCDLCLTHLQGASLTPVKRNSD